MTISECGGTRTVTLTIRFCFAPTSSSPSRMSTGVAPEFLTRSSGTWPAAETSVTFTVPSASASSRLFGSIASRGSLARMGVRVRLR